MLLCPLSKVCICMILLLRNCICMMLCILYVCSYTQHKQGELKSNDVRTTWHVEVSNETA